MTLPTPPSSHRLWRLGVLAVLAGCTTAPTGAPPAASPAATPAAAATAADATTDFAAWRNGFRARAAAAGIGEAMLRAALDPVQPLPRVVELDRAQPEFTRTVWDYLDSAVSPQRVARGKERLQQVQSMAPALAGRYGVPTEVVVAISGLESNYGQNVGDIPTLDALATLAFDGRRRAWAEDQLLAALRIVQAGDIHHDRMVGSWAGAMGQTQFLPTNFLAYAVDADGDGRRDLWGSTADVVASTANFLSRVGWQAGQPWGVEVRLPPGFDLLRADDRLRRSADVWMAEGLRTADGGPLPATLADASVLLPAGVRGPAFLVGPNFRAVLRYNNATAYALAIGLLSQRLANGPGVQAPWPRELRPLSRGEVIAMQTALNDRGFDSGAADGLLGPATRDAVRRFQRSAGLPPDGFADAALLQRLLPP
jgi:lytic murein transglycosylase